ncbi:MAG: fenitrothion hydrolase [Actinomycetota bacterium]
MTRRLFALAVASGLLVLATPAPVLAHGIGGRVDLPVPRWLFVYGAAAAVIASFVALAILWKEPRLEGREGSYRFPEPLQRLLTSRVLERMVRGFSLFIFLVVTAAAAFGEPFTSANIAPIFVYVWFWVGLAFAHALLGNLWATLSPWDTLARLLDIPRGRPRPYPTAWGKWPATVLLLAFVWLELVFPEAASPPALAVAILIYAGITLAGMAVYGREAWNENGEAFAVYFGLLSRIAPLARDRSGRVIVRPVLGGLPSLEPRPGLVAFVAVLLGSTTFDGFSRSTLWLSKVGALPQSGRMVAGTAGLLGMIGLVASAYWLAMQAAASIAGSGWHPLALRFVHSLVPIALAYVVAHYFSLLVLEGQLGLALLSDPFGVGWDLFGTASWVPNLALVSPNVVWYVQVGAIVAGHIGGVVLAHDRAVAAFPPARALRTQFALLAVMVLFTAGGLLILSGP